ncbi:MAG: PQQ-binding-like beta-propeller repeat protein [Planctomycetes bacterium]|nr:PQQ-binding-like beta-propeller repeat protein [Planctomycetota bacterium]
MALVGDLGSVDLAQVFQVLSGNQKDGVLDIFRGEEHRGVRVRRGVLTLQFDRDVYEERVLEMLRRLGRVSEQKLQVAAANRHGTQESLITALVKMQVLTDEEVESIYRERMAEDLYDLFTWHDARFEFHEGAQLLEHVGGEVDERLCFPSDGVVMEAVHRLDEWRRIRERVADDDEVMEALVAEQSCEDDTQEAVFRCVDGMRTVGEIARSLGRSIYEVSKAVSRLAELGAVGPVHPDHYPERGRLALQAGRPRDAAKLFDRAAAAGVACPASIGDAGRAFEADREFALAAERFVAYGDALVQIEERDRALDAYRHARALVPTHISAWRKAIDLALESDPGASEGMPSSRTAALVAEGRVLAETLTELADLEGAAGVLERALLRAPSDIAAKRQLVALWERLGQHDRLCGLLESLSDDLLHQRDVLGAAGCLQRVLRMRPERRDLVPRIRDLYKRDESRRNWKKALVGGFVSLLLAAAVGLLVMAREKRALAELSAIDVEPRMRSGDLAGVRARLEEFRASNPLTWASTKAEELLVRVDALAAEFEKQQERKRAEAKKAYDDQIAKADSEAKRSEETARSGRLSEALEILRAALREAPADWPSAKLARRNVTDLEAYLSGSSALAKDLAAAEHASDWARARKLGRELAAKYPLTEEARHVRLPYKVTTNPPGASILLNGELAGTSPCVVHVPLVRKQNEVRASLVGYAPAATALDVTEDSVVELSLGRAPEWSAPLPAAAAVQPIQYGATALVSLSAGHVLAFGKEPAPLWKTQIISGGEIVGWQVAPDGSAVAVATDGAVVCLEPASSKHRWRVDLGVGVRVPPLADKEGVFIASDDGRIRLLGYARGEVLREWRGIGRTGGRIVRYQSRLVVGSSDGRLRVVDAENPRGEEAALSFGAPLVGAVVVDGVLVVTGDDGRIAGFDLETLKLTFEKPGGRIAQAVPSAVGNRVLVDIAGKLTLIEPRSGAIVASVPVMTEVVGAPAAAGELVFVALRDGAVLALRAADLSSVWSWPGTRAQARFVATGDALWVAAGKSIHRFDLGADAGPVR